MAPASYSCKPRTVSNNWKRVFNLTHFIRIPFLNQTSAPQIQETLWRVANDPVAASVPPLAYGQSQELKVSVASLSLPTQKSRDHAISLLQKLGKHDWQKLFLRIQQSRPNTRKPSSASPESLSDEDVGQIGPQPLVVSVILEVMFCQSCHVCVPSHVSVANHL